MATKEEIIISKEKILEDIQSLIQDIDECVNEISRASIEMDFEAFVIAKDKESSLLAQAYQELSFLYDYIKEGGGNEIR